MFCIYIWSFSFLILWLGIPVAAALLGFGLFKAIKAIRRARKAKNALAKDQNPNLTNQHQQNAQLDHAQQLGQTQQQKEIKKQPSENVQDLNTEAASEAEFLKKLPHNFRFWASDFDMISKDRDAYRNWLGYQKMLHNPKAESHYEVAKERVKAYNNYFLTNYGREPTIPPEADFCVSVKDEEDNMIKDNRNYCSTGVENSQFAQYYANNQDDARQNDRHPTILQIKIPGQRDMQFATTSKEGFMAGCQDMLAQIKKSNATEYTAYCVFGENQQDRKLSTANCKNLNELGEFLKNTLTPAQAHEDKHEHEQTIAL